MDNTDGAPFPRGYSDELRHHSIFEHVVLELLDGFNVARIPNPEGQITQKGANIAGWCVYVPSKGALDAFYAC
jgi:hypothetical protein